MPCPNPSGLFVPRDPDGDLTPIPAPCGKWDCPHCSKVKKNKLLDRVTACFKGERVRMWTLTIREGCNDEQIGKAWARVRSNLSKQGFIAVKFFWVKEFQENGQRHMHVLISARVDWNQETLKRYWHLATEKTSWQTDRTEGTEDLRTPAGYISKYMTKGFCGGEMEHHFNRKERRYGTSRGFPPTPPPPGPRGLYCYRSNGQVSRYGVPGTGSQDTAHQESVDRMSYRVWSWWKYNWRRMERAAYERGEDAHNRFLDEKALRFGF